MTGVATNASRADPVLFCQGQGGGLDCLFQRILPLMKGDQQQLELSADRVCTLGYFVQPRRLLGGTRRHPIYCQLQLVHLFIQGRHGPAEPAVGSAQVLQFLGKQPTIDSGGASCGKQENVSNKSHRTLVQHKFRDQKVPNPALAGDDLDTPKHLSP